MSAQAAAAIAGSNPSRPEDAPAALARVETFEPDVPPSFEEVGIVEKSGSHFVFEGDRFANGRDKAREALLENTALLETLKTRTTVAPTAPAADVAATAA